MIEQLKSIRHIYLSAGLKEAVIITHQKSTAAIMSYLVPGTTGKYVVFKELGALGRLGNQFFQIAATLGIAEKNNAVAGICYWRFAKYLNVPVSLFHLPGVKTKRYQDKEQGFEEIKIIENTELFGFFQTEKYFTNIESTIRSYFSLKPKYESELRSYIHAIGKPVVSLHVRRGDFIKWNLQTLDVAYYEKAMQYFPDNCVFLVFSDDILWCRTQFKGKKFLFRDKEHKGFSTGLNDLLDLFLMSYCQHHITANSTFSWWGAWLNPNKNKIVICQKYWNDRSEGYNRDILPQGWIGID